MDSCPPWVSAENDSQLPEVVAGLERIHQFLRQRAPGYVLGHGDLKTWHSTIFKNVVPLFYYAGNYRCSDPALPCLNVNVRVGANSGAPFAEVPALMSEFSHSMVSEISRTDSFLRGGASRANQILAIVELAAFCMGRFVQIHPFLNGNGRICRMIGNYTMERYGFPSLHWPPIVRPAGEYESASEASMRGDFTPMKRYLLVALSAQSS